MVEKIHTEDELVLLIQKFMKDYYQLMHGRATQRGIARAKERKQHDPRNK